MGIIEDGRGTGKKARVGKTNRLDVSAKSNGRLFYVSRDEELSFSINLDLTQITGDSTEILGYIKYNGNGQIYINNITFSSEEPGTGLSKFGIWKNCSVSGGTEKSSNNLNFTSVLISEATTFVGPDITCTDGFSIGTIRMSGANSFERSYDDALILGRGNSLTIKVNTASLGTETRATIVFWESND